MAAPKGHDAYSGGGRPAGSKGKASEDIRLAAQQIFEKRGGIDAVFKRFLESEDEDIAFKATTLMAAYGFGKPKETHEVTGADGGAVSLVVKLVKSDGTIENAS